MAGSYVPLPHPPNVPFALIRLGLGDCFFRVGSYWAEFIDRRFYDLRFRSRLPSTSRPNRFVGSAGDYAASNHPCYIPGLGYRTSRRQHQERICPNPSGVFRRLGDRMEFQGDSIHAVALPSRLGPVVEHVAEMTAAAPAMHFRSWNEQAVIVRGADSVLDRREKARPASAAIEFGFGAKERQIAGRTSEQTGAMLVIERAGIWPLRPTLPQHLELFGRQDLLPFRLRL